MCSPHSSHKPMSCTRLRWFTPEGTSSARLTATSRPSASRAWYTDPKLPLPTFFSFKKPPSHGTLAGGGDAYDAGITWCPTAARTPSLMPAMLSAHGAQHTISRQSTQPRPPMPPRTPAHQVLEPWLKNACDCLAHLSLSGMQKCGLPISLSWFGDGFTMSRQVSLYRLLPQFGWNC